MPRLGRRQNAARMDRKTMKQNPVRGEPVVLLGNPPLPPRVSLAPFPSNSLSSFVAFSPNASYSAKVPTSGCSASR